MSLFSFFSDFTQMKLSYKLLHTYIQSLQWSYILILACRKVFHHIYKKGPGLHPRTRPFVQKLYLAAVFSLKKSLFEFLPVSQNPGQNCRHLTSWKFWSKSFVFKQNGCKIFFEIIPGVKSTAWFCGNAYCIFNYIHSIPFQHAIYHIW